MSKKTEIIDVEETELVEEVHERIDVLISILKEKGILGEKEYENKLKDFLEEKYNQ